MATYFRANRETVNEVHGLDRTVEMLLGQVQRGEDLNMTTLNTAIAK